LSLDVDCNDTSTSLGINYEGEEYGDSSKCINAEFTASKRQMPACFKVTCDAEKYQVVVNGITCTYDGEIHTIKTVKGETATFECPRISLVCPELSCPSDCTGRGTCDYSKKPPQCNCMNNADTANCQVLDNTTMSPPPAPTPSPVPVTASHNNDNSSAVSSLTSSAAHRQTSTTATLLILLLALKSR
jgi:hypothetical protein